MEKSCNSCIHRHVCKLYPRINGNIESNIKTTAEHCPHYIPKCTHPEGITIKPDGINELDPCVYQTIEKHYDCMVEISQCVKCGNIDISWCRATASDEDVE